MLIINYHQIPCIALDSWGHMTLFILLRDGPQCHELSYGAMKKKKKDPLAFTQSSDWIPEAPLFLFLNPLGIDRLCLAGSSAHKHLLFLRHGTQMQDCDISTHVNYVF